MNKIIGTVAVLFTIAIGCWLTPSAPAFAGDLEPPGPPAPTMRTLDSLGFDCPSDVANARSNLIYTLVISGLGLDTGIAISNTGADPFGTTPPACPGNVCQCTLNFYGTNAPMAFNTTSIGPGTTYLNRASIVAPDDFVGYVIAACNFPYAHGFARVVDREGESSAGSAAAYLAQVICSDRGSTAMGAGR